MNKDRKAEVEYFLFQSRASVELNTEEIEELHRVIEEIERESKSSKKLAKHHEGRIEYILSHIMPLYEGWLESAKMRVAKYEAELEQLTYLESDGQVEFNW